ncbi:hypothetical protein ABK040_005701 [Willaertia magna]
MSTTNSRQLKSSLFGGSRENSPATQPTINNHSRSIYNEQEEDLEHEEFNKQTGELGNNARALKELAHDMNDELAVQVDYLRGTNIKATEANTSLGKTMKKLDEILEVKTTRHMCIIIWSIVIIFFIFYYSIRFLYQFLFGGNTK